MTWRRHEIFCSGHPALPTMDLTPAPGRRGVKFFGRKHTLQDADADSDTKKNKTGKRDEDSPFFSSPVIRTSTVRGRMTRIPFIPNGSRGQQPWRSPESDLTPDEKGRGRARDGSERERKLTAREEHPSGTGLVRRTSWTGNRPRSASPSWAIRALNDSGTRSDRNGAKALGPISRQLVVDNPRTVASRKSWASHSRGGVFDLRPILPSPAALRSWRLSRE